MQILWRKRSDRENNYTSTKLFPLHVLRINATEEGLKLSCVNTSLNGAKLFRDSELYKTALLNEHIDIILLYVNPVNDEIIRDQYGLRAEDVLKFKADYSYSVGQVPIIDLTI